MYHLRLDLGKCTVDRWMRYGSVLPEKDAAVKGGGGDSCDGKGGGCGESEEEREQKEEAKRKKALVPRTGYLSTVEQWRKRAALQQGVTSGTGMMNTASKMT